MWQGLSFPTCQVGVLPLQVAVRPQGSLGRSRSEELALRCSRPLQSLMMCLLLWFCRLSLTYEHLFGTTVTFK